MNNLKEIKEKLLNDKERLVIQANFHEGYTYYFVRKQHRNYDLNMFGGTKNHRWEYNLDLSKPFKSVKEAERQFNKYLKNYEEFSKLEGI